MSPILRLAEQEDLNQLRKFGGMASGSDLLGRISADSKNRPSIATLDRLAELNLIKAENGNWFLTPLGKTYIDLASNKFYTRYFSACLLVCVLIVSLAAYRLLFSP